MYQSGNSIYEVGRKVFWLILVQGAIFVPVFLLSYVSLSHARDYAPIDDSFYYTIWFIGSLLIALFIRSNRFVPDDIVKASQINATVDAVVGLLVVLQGPGAETFFILIAFSASGYFIPKWFLEYKFRKYH